MELIFLIFVSFFIILMFFLINYALIKKKYNEYYEKLPEGTLCGTKNDICNIDQNGINSCCEGYLCVRPKGNFQYKVCVKPENDYVNISSGTSSGSSSGSGSVPDANTSINPIIFPKFHFPSISKPELPSKINIFSKDFWNTNRICKIDNNS